MIWGEYAFFTNRQPFILFVLSNDDVVAADAIY